MHPMTDDRMTEILEGIALISKEIREMDALIMGDPLENLFRLGCEIVGAAIVATGGVAGYLPLNMSGSTLLLWRQNAHGWHMEVSDVYDRHPRTIAEINEYLTRETSMDWMSAAG